MPFAGFLDKGEFREDWRAETLRASEVFVGQAALSDEQRGRIKTLVEHGPPEMLVHAYMRDHGVDLVVVAAHSGKGVLDRRLGGTAKRILETAPGDVLLVPQRAVRI
ncbi:universal stress protein [Phenylobacterium sp. J367]|nr:universal stress protein [Phenylobacterium sp. J367]